MKLKDLANESLKSFNTKGEKGHAKNERNTTKNYCNISAVETSIKSNETKSVSFEDHNTVNDQKRPTANSRPGSMKMKRKLKLEKLKFKRKMKKENKKRELEEDKAMPDTIKETIKFGEIVHRPPQISTLPRKVSKPNFENRVGICMARFF